MSINQIRLYDLFRKELHLPDDKAAAFVVAVGDVVESEATNKNHLLATKGDFYSLKEDMHALKNDMYKAMFLTGIVQLVAILGGTLAIVRLIK